MGSVKRFLLRSLLFCLIPMPILYLLNYVIDSGLRKSKYVYYQDWNEIFSGNINADLLIMGSSRAWVQFSPAIIDSVLHLNSYNMGFDGACFDLQYKKLKIYLQHNKKPKYIVQEVGYINTLHNVTWLPGVQQFMPYLNDTSMWNIVENSDSKLNFFDRYFPCYKYNNEFVVIKEGIKSFMGKGVKGTLYKGYEGQSKPWDSSYFEFKRDNPYGWKAVVDSDGLHEFKQYIEFCSANGIKLILVFPPAYSLGMKDLVNLKEVRSIYEQFTKQYHIPFYNYENDPLALSRSNFYNSEHLNKSGSEKFSVEFANDIKKEIN